MHSGRPISVIVNVCVLKLKFVNRRLLFYLPVALDGVSNMSVFIKDLLGHKA
jgi:hypothetical protein